MSSVSQLNNFKRIFNTYGKRSLKNYGIDVKPEIYLGIGEDIVVKITEKIPPVIKVNDSWDEFRYNNSKDVIISVLRECAELLQMDPYSVVLSTTPVLHDTYGSYNLGKDINDWAKTAFNKDREFVVSPVFFYVNDGSYAISKRSAISYPVSTKHKIYGEDGFNLPDIENQDWWDSLDDGDKDEMIAYFG